jgi:hypothetical protein
MPAVAIRALYNVLSAAYKPSDVLGNVEKAGKMGMAVINLAAAGAEGDAMETEGGTLTVVEDAAVAAAAE